MTPNPTEFTVQLMLQDSKENTLPLWGGEITNFNNLIKYIVQEYKEYVQKNLDSLHEKIKHLDTEIDRREKLLNDLQNKTVIETRELIRKELKTNYEIIDHWAQDIENQMEFLDECQRKANDSPKDGSVQTEIAKTIMSVYSPFMTQNITRLKDMRRRQSKLIPDSASDTDLDKAFQNKLDAITEDIKLIIDEKNRTKRELIINSDILTNTEN